MMTTIDVWESDLAFWSDQSLFSNDCNQTQYECDITSKLGSGKTEQLDSFELLENLELGNIELNIDFEYFNNDPQPGLEVMTTEVVLPKTDTTNAENYHILDPLATSPFLSPPSTAPSSPQQSEDNFELCSEQLFTDYELDSIISVNSSDNEDSQQLLVSAFDLVNDLDQLIGESNAVAFDQPMLDSVGDKRKRQVKRKSSDFESEPTISKRNKRSKPTLIDKKERKKDQNKSAANRYRQKKRVEQESIDSLLDEQLKRNEDLKSKVEKLQMEFKVLFPLASAAFASDIDKSLKLIQVNKTVIEKKLLY